MQKESNQDQGAAPVASVHHPKDSKEAKHQVGVLFQSAAQDAAHLPELKRVLKQDLISSLAVLDGVGRDQQCFRVLKGAALAGDAELFTLLLETLKADLVLNRLTGAAGKPVDYIAEILLTAGYHPQSLSLFYNSINARYGKAVLFDASADTVVDKVLIAAARQEMPVTGEIEMKRGSTKAQVVVVNHLFNIGAAKGKENLKVPDFPGDHHERATLLSAAFDRFNIEFMKILLEQRANAFVRPLHGRGKTMLSQAVIQWVADSKVLNIIKLMAEQPGLVNIPNEDTETTPLDDAAFKYDYFVDSKSQYVKMSSSSPKMVAVLLDHGARSSRGLIDTVKSLPPRDEKNQSATLLLLRINLIKNDLIEFLESLQVGSSLSMFSLPHQPPGGPQLAQPGGNIIALLAKIRSFKFESVSLEQKNAASASSSDSSASFSLFSSIHSASSSSLASSGPSASSASEAKGQKASASSSSASSPLDVKGSAASASSVDPDIMLVPDKSVWSLDLLRQCIATIDKLVKPSAAEQAGLVLPQSYMRFESVKRILKSICPEAFALGLATSSVGAGPASRGAPAPAGK